MLPETGPGVMFVATTTVDTGVPPRWLHFWFDGDGGAKVPGGEG